MLSHVACMSVQFSVANKSKSSPTHGYEHLTVYNKTGLYLVYLALVLQNHVYHFFNIVCPSMYHDFIYICTQNLCLCRSQ